MAKDKEIDIIALPYPDNIRTRLGMYLGSNEDPSVGLREVIDNSVDELMGSISGTKIDIQIKQGQSGGYYVVADNGRGIPILWDDEYQMTKTQLAMTRINAGSKFDGKGGISSGINGTGASAFNAVCDEYIVLSKITANNAKSSIDAVKDLWNRVNINVDEPFYYIYFQKGIKIEEGADTKNNLQKKFGFEFPDKMSTITAFKPDPTIWLSTVANYNKKALQYVGVILDKFLHKTCQIFIDGVEVSDKFEPYQFEFIREINLPYNNDTIRHAKFYVNFDVDKDLSVQESSGSVNSIIVNRGLHVDCTRKAYCDALKNYFHIYHEHLTPGLKFNVICLASNVDYSSQTKERVTKIDNLWTEDIVPALSKEFRQIFRDNEEYFQSHVARLNEYAESLTKISAINKVKQIVGTVEGGNRVRSKIPTSVKDAASNNRMECELYICEGKSAASTLIKARNPKIHAILPLRGIPLNSINADLDTILDNEEMRGLITAIGSGVNEYFNLDSARYGKIILAADADADGGKICSMILGTIAKKMTFLLDDGRVFIAISPLYVQGDKKVYAGQDPAKIIDVSKSFKRYKGLGELNVSEAKEFFFNEDTRNLMQVTTGNLDYVFELLTISSVRKDLMVKNDIIVDKYNTGIV